MSTAEAASALRRDTVLAVDDTPQEQGVDQSTVHRIWQQHGLQPHRQETFKLSRDPEFVPKLLDVVGCI